MNKNERAWRRRGEAKRLLAAVQAAEARFAAFDRAVHLLLSDPEGRRQLARYGITQRWCARSLRGADIGGSGLSVLEGVVLAGVCNRSMEDAALVRWMSRAQPVALQELHAVVSSDSRVC